MNNSPMYESPMALALANLLDQGALPLLDDTVADRSGGVMYCQDPYIWHFNCRTQRLKFRWIINNELLEHEIKAHVQSIAKRTSVRNAYNTAIAITTLLKSANAYPILSFSQTTDEYENALSSSMEQIFSDLEISKQLDKFWRLKNFYRWGCLFALNGGFNVQKFLKYAQIEIPGNEKGAAVRTGHHDNGALHPDDLQQIITALREDKPESHRELIEHIVVALGIALGRNAENFTLLLEHHVIQLTHNNINRYYLRIPRIKKRKNPYSELKTVPIEPTLGQMLMKLVATNQPRDIDTTGPIGAKITRLMPANRPLLRAGKTTTPQSSNAAWRHFLVPSQVTTLMKSFVKRKKIKSKHTQKLITINPRRLRYTFGTNLAARGVSARELASLLDHSDIQNVRVYTDLSRILSDRLEKAASGKIEFVLDLLTGKIKPENINQDGSTSNDRNLRPQPTTNTRPCSSCAAFQAYAHVASSHEFPTSSTKKVTNNNGENS